MKGKKSKDKSFKTLGVARAPDDCAPGAFKSSRKDADQSSEKMPTFSSSISTRDSGTDGPIQVSEASDPTAKTAVALVEKAESGPEGPTQTDKRQFGTDNWLARNGHSLTYAGIFLFTLVLYFRPYELIPALSGFHSMALIIAVATLLIFLPSQFSVEGTLTTLPTEVKCVLFITAWALLTIPIAKDPRLAWETFTDTFIKVLLMFVIMVNTLRSKRRLSGLMFLGIGVGIMLSYQAVDLYQKGEFKTDGYRVSVDFGGMFGNPNDMAIHLVIFVPIAIALGAAARNKFAKVAYFAGAAIMAAGSFVTQSRGAFLGLVALSAVLVWKLGRSQRFKSVLIAGIVGIVVILLAPGNYGLRVASIFIPALDPVGSSGQRTDLLMRSIVVTLRNPLGIGIGNFQIVGDHNLGTHNAFTQVSSELGWFSFAAYLIMLLNPFRKLGMIERQLFETKEFSWIYYLSIGIQASIAGYMASSFFSSVAYQWYIYYPIAYAICIRRIYYLGAAETTATNEDRRVGELGAASA